MLIGAVDISIDLLSNQLLNLKNQGPREPLIDHHTHVAFAERVVLVTPICPAPTEVIKVLQS
jgi:hypothetical protein